MSNFRQIHTKIWKDDWFLDLKPISKLFFIYLFSNERACLAGIYELPIRVMAFESGLTNLEIKNAFKIFSEAQKAHYRDGVVWIPNLRKYHETTSDKVQTRIIKDVAAVKECELKGIYCDLYGIDRVSENENRVSIPPYTYTSTNTSTNTSKKAPQKKKKAPVTVVIPDCLSTPDFLATWDDFTEHRKEIKKPMTPRAANMALKKLKLYTPVMAIAMIEQSIAGGWQSIFELKNNGGKPARGERTPQHETVHLAGSY